MEDLMKYLQEQSNPLEGQEESPLEKKVELSEGRFVVSILEQVKYHQMLIRDLENQIGLHEQYLTDYYNMLTQIEILRRQGFTITYYRQGNNLFYEAKEKGKMGFLD